MKYAVIVGVVVLLLGVMIVDGFFVVNEGELAIVTQFGKPVGEGRAPGLYLKVPFIQEIRRFESRILKWDGDPKEIPTLDKRYIWVDSTARWRITDPLQFFTRMKDYQGAQSRLDDIIDSAVRNAVSAHLLIEIVRTKDYAATALPEAIDLDERVVAARNLKGREVILEEVVKEAGKKIREFGIELVDVQIKRINLSKKVQQRVYERMVNERKKAAAEFRSEGEGQKAEILGQMQKELKRIESGAYRTALEIRGKGDAEAARIYAEAYSRDTDFYAFSRTLDSYRKGIFGRGRFLVNTDSEFFKYLKKTD